MLNMKTLKIYERDVTERTGYRKYPYKVVRQYHVLYDGQEDQWLKLT